MRLRLLLRITILCFFSSILLSLPLWFGDKEFPKLPAFDLFESPANWLEVGCFVLMMISCLTIFINQKFRLVFWLLITSLLLLMLIDLNRVQVWTFMFGISFLSFSLLSPVLKQYGNTQNLSNGLRIILLAAYFWIGVNKLNPDFFSTVLPYVTAPLQHKFQWFMYFEELSYPVPFIQILAIPALLWKRTRNWTVIFMSFFHLAVILLVGVFSYNGNSVIIPLNIFFISALLLLFYRQEFDLKEFRLRSRSMAFSILAVLILPAFSWFLPYPHNLSLDIYSGRYSFDPIAIDASKIEQIPDYLNKHSSKYGPHIYFDVYRWSMEEMNVPPFYESYILDDYEEILIKRCTQDSN